MEPTLEIVLKHINYLILKDVKALSGYFLTFEFESVSFEQCFHKSSKAAYKFKYDFISITFTEEKRFYFENKYKKIIRYHFLPYLRTWLQIWNFISTIFREWVSQI